MNVAFIGEGDLDDILIPPLVTTLAKENGIEWPVYFKQDIRSVFPRATGFGGVKEGVRKIVEAIEKSPDIMKKRYHKYIVLLDEKTEETQREILNLIDGKADFMLGIAIKEIESWVLADRDHVIEWLGINKQDCPELSFWSASYRAETDPDPKKTLDQLLKFSKSEYDTWCKAAAIDFVEKYWKNSFLPDERIEMDEWDGKLNSTQMKHQCPVGFVSFESRLIALISGNRRT